MRNRIGALALVIFLLCGLLSGCGGDADRAAFSFLLAQAPVTLDPQLAESASERMLVRNLYEGLMRVDADGAIVPACADRYEQDGLTYRFYLSDQAVWSNGDELVADDFVFAFRRAADPTTNAPDAGLLRCIAGAEAGSAGGNLGVRAIDDATLEITLSRPDRNFLETLTTAICMPCHRAFFEKTNGKYGRDQESVLSNGSYKLRRWDPPDDPAFFLRLTRSSEYRGRFPARNASVRFSLPDEDDNPPDEIRDGAADGALLDGLSLDAAATDGLTVQSYADTAWVLAIRPDMHADLRRALVRSIDRSRYADQLTGGAVAAERLTPPDLYPADAMAGRASHIPAYDPEGARNLFSKAVLELPDKHFPATTLLYYDMPLLKEIAATLAAHWQQNLGAYLNIEPVASLSELTARAAAQNYQMALIPVTAGYDAFAAPDFFTRCLALTGRANQTVSDGIAALRTGIADHTAAELADTVDRMEAALLGDDTVVPIFCTRTVLLFHGTLRTGRLTRYNGMIDFAYVTRTPQ